MAHVSDVCAPSPAVSKAIYFFEEGSGDQRDLLGGKGARLAALVLGYAGVYSSFMRHAENASKRFGVPTAKILEAVGKRKAIGGQKDVIIECAIELAQAEGVAASPELVIA